MAAVDCGFAIAAITRAERRGRSLRRRRRCGTSRTSRAKAFVDFQNDVTVEGHRARRSRRLPLGRASEALHHARHGDRPGQDLERDRPRDHGRGDRPHDPAGRHHDLSPALHAGEHRRAGRPSSRPRISARRACRRRIDGRASRARCSSRPALWLRAQYYPRAGEKDWLETVNREVTATRASVGVCDVSTLGKIEIQGADAAAFLDRVYMQHVLDACRSARRATG